MLREQLGSINLLVDAVSSAEEACQLLSFERPSGDYYRLVLVDADILQSNVSLQQKQQKTYSFGCHWVLMAARASLVGLPNLGRIQDVLDKPVRPSRLFSLIVKVLSHQAGYQAKALVSQEKPPVDAPEVSPLVRILLAEDNPTTRRMLAISLKSRNCDVIHAENGKQAVALALEQPFDLILMDCQMPIMDGYQAVAQLRQHGVNTPVIAMTAHSQREVANHCQEVGMDDYLAKPFKHQYLYSIIDKWVKFPSSESATIGSENFNSAVVCHAPKD